jgi:hypothetical protein
MTHWIELALPLLIFIYNGTYSFSGPVRQHQFEYLVGCNTCIIFIKK